MAERPGMTQQEIREAMNNYLLTAGLTANPGSPTLQEMKRQGEAAKENQPTIQQDSLDRPDTRPR